VLEIQKILTRTDQRSRVFFFWKRSRQLGQVATLCFRMQRKRGLYLLIFACRQAGTFRGSTS
jgi:hypothetical protein